MNLIAFDTLGNYYSPFPLLSNQKKQISEVDKKTVHVVFKYLSSSLLYKEVGAGGVTPPRPHPIS
jgi:hypothetical protein